MAPLRRPGGRSSHRRRSTELTTEIVLDAAGLAEALARAGRHEDVRAQVFEALRRAETSADDGAAFREEVRWPLVLALLQDVKRHDVVLENGLVFEVGPDSRIDKALLLSPELHPDHVWEPQTTRLVVALAARATHVIVGGAYIGDQALPMAHAMDATGVVHAFEPMEHAYQRLVRNIERNSIDNVIPNRLSLWDSSDIQLRLSGQLALASSSTIDGAPGDDDEVVTAITIGDYQRRAGLPSIGLITLDTEGGEERALLGATEVLELPVGEAPNIVFEIHREFVDWSDGLEKTAIVQMLQSYGYHLFAIRDFHDNIPMGTLPIEVIPIDRVYLEGPPHGFNVLAIKDRALIQELGLKIVESVSPKLLLDRDPALHHPTGGLPAVRVPDGMLAPDPEDRRGLTGAESPTRPSVARC